MDHLNELLARSGGREQKLITTIEVDQWFQATTANTVYQSSTARGTIDQENCNELKNSKRDLTEVEYPYMSQTTLSQTSI